MHAGEACASGWRGMHAYAPWMPNKFTPLSMSPRYTVALADRRVPPAWATCAARSSGSRFASVSCILAAVGGLQASKVRYKVWPGGGRVAWSAR